MSTRTFKEEEFNTDSFDTSLWLKVLRLLSEHKKLILAMTLTNTVVALIDVLYPYFNKQAIDYYVNGTGVSESITGYVLIFVGCVLLQGVGCFLFFTIAGHIEMNFSYSLRKKLVSKLQELSYSYYDTHPSGWLMARVTSDVASLSEIMSWELMDIVWGFTVMIGVVIMMLIHDVKLACIVISITVPLALFASKFQIRILKNYREVRRTNSRITSAFSEGISGAKTIKTLVLEESNEKEFKSLTREMYDKSVSAATFSALLRPLILTLQSFCLAFILWLGGNQVLSGVMEFGTLYLFTQSALQFFDPLNRIAELIAELQLAQASAERVLSLLEEEPTVKDSLEVTEKYGTLLEPKMEVYEPIHGDVSFEHVSFHYLPEEPILEDFNLEVKAGEMVALVGETGSGKSTIVNLLCRFYEPTKGRIIIDGVDYRERSLGWLHENLGYVLQSPQLFAGTIADNIRYGKLDATMEEIIEAAEYVNAHEFICKLEKGYDTEVGESGGRLSTGEKQLISFARAIIRKPSIFVLDEATSSVDTETEQIIQHAITTLLKGKTSFVIAHRLSTIVSADKILVIKNGRVIEQGNHDHLMKMQGYYYRLYTNQFHEDQQNQLLKLDQRTNAEQSEADYYEEED